MVTFVHIFTGHSRVVSPVCNTVRSPRAGVHVGGDVPDSRTAARPVGRRSSVRFPPSLSRGHVEMGGVEMGGRARNASLGVVAIPKLHVRSFYPTLLHLHRRADEALWALICTAWIDGGSSSSHSLRCSLFARMISTGSSLVSQARFLSSTRPGPASAARGPGQAHAPGAGMLLSRCGGCAAGPVPGLRASPASVRFCPPAVPQAGSSAGNAPPR